MGSPYLLASTLGVNLVKVAGNCNRKIEVKVKAKIKVKIESELFIVSNNRNY